MRPLVHVVQTARPRYQHLNHEIKPSTTGGRGMDERLVQVQDERLLLLGKDDAAAREEGVGEGAEAAVEGDEGFAMF